MADNWVVLLIQSWLRHWVIKNHTLVLREYNNCDIYPYIERTNIVTETPISFCLLLQANKLFPKQIPLHIILFLLIKENVISPVLVYPTWDSKYNIPSRKSKTRFHVYFPAHSFPLFIHTLNFELKIQNRHCDSTSFIITS